MEDTMEQGLTMEEVTNRCTRIANGRIDHQLAGQICSQRPAMLALGLH